MGEALGAARRVRGRDQVRHGHAGGRPRPGARASRATCDGGRGQPAPAADRPHRPLPAARARRHDADRGDPVRADRPGPRGQDRLPRLLELRGLAGRGRRLDRPVGRAGAVRRRAEPLLVARPPIEDEVIPPARPSGWGCCLLPAGVRPADRQVPPRRGRPAGLAGEARPDPRAVAATCRLGRIEAVEAYAEARGLAVARVAIAGLAAQPRSRR